MTTADYEKCARRIAAALKLASGERILLKLDTRVFAPLVPPLQNLIRASGAHISGVVLAEDTETSSDGELDSLRRLFSNADVFIWLPEIRQGNRPALRRAINEWLDEGRGRAVHFHWHGGSYPIGLSELPSQDFIDRIHLAALDINPDELEEQHRRAIALLGSGRVRVTTPEGTDISFEVGNRPFCSQIGDASFRASMRTKSIRSSAQQAGMHGCFGNSRSVSIQRYRFFPKRRSLPITDMEPASFVSVWEITRKWAEQTGAAACTGISSTTQR